MRKFLQVPFKMKLHQITAFAISIIMLTLSTNSAKSQVYDLALINGISTDFSRDYCPGDEVRFNTVLYNTGEVEACNVQITAYIPAGMSASNNPLNSIWTINGSLATANITSCIPPGGMYPNLDSDQLSAFLVLELDNPPSSSITFYSEISQDDGDDVDSNPDNNPDNDALIEGVIFDPADEDDHDLTIIKVREDCTTPGCTDPCAPNYDSTATSNDGSCEDYARDCNRDICDGDETNWNRDTCSCELITTRVIGCADRDAENYNPDANCNERDTCIYPPGEYDLALVTGISPSFGSVYCPGEEVRFNVVIYNRGEEEACDVEITAYIPDGMSVSDNSQNYIWTVDGSLATANISSCIPPGDQYPDSGTDPLSAFLILEITGDSGTEINFYAEISADDGDDIDSTPDNNPDNDPVVNNEINNPDDEDDHDIATITIGNCNVGCTDPCAPNYDATANDDDGSCEDYDRTCNRDICAGDETVFDRNTCQCEVRTTQVIGCDDRDANNYNPDANCSDPDSCTYSYDLALITTLSSGFSSTVDPGDEVGFSTTVYNQGSIEACNVEVTAYIPDGMSLSDNPSNSIWTVNGNQATTTIDTCIDPGRQETIRIYLTLDSTDAGSAINFYAEISMDDGDDIDSTPDNDNSNDAGAVPNSETDNELDGDMGDEDDHDVAQIIVAEPGEYDLALITDISTTFGTEYCPGDEVRYNVVIYNTGEVEACEVEVTAYIPDGMSVSDNPQNTIWTVNGSLATANITSCITPGGQYPNSNSDDLSAFLILEITGDPGTVINFYAEISMDDGDDIDSTPDNNPDNDGDIRDNSISDDEDDHDVASITIKNCNEGCTDRCAPNYDASAYFDDGSCEDYDRDCNRDICAGDETVFDRNTCQCEVRTTQVIGCDDRDANNYNPDANCSDPDSCTYSYDLALITTLSSGFSSTVDPGDEVGFSTTVYNQGSIEACNVEVTAYIPDGMSLSDNPSNSIWTVNGNQATTTINTCIDPGRQETVRIYLTLDSTDAGSAINFYAEISMDDGEDIDSTADNDNSNDAGAVPNSETDNELNGDMGDEDDHDVAQIIVAEPGEYDLGLITGISPSFGSVYCPGEEVRFNIVIYNTGEEEACDVEITAYIPDGMSVSENSLNSSLWTVNGSLATTNITSCIPPGGKYPDSGTDPLSAFLILEITGDPGTEINFYAEISADDGDDIDSTPDNNPDNDPVVDNEVNDPDDEDDHDIETITIGNCNKGCTDPCAPNYDATANDDDGSCEDYSRACNRDICDGDVTDWDRDTCSCELITAQVIGCDDRDAENYNPDANCNDPDTCIYPSNYDLALTTMLASGYNTTVNPGDEVGFTTTVYNQGDEQACNVEVTVYIPIGMSLSDNSLNSIWTVNGVQATTTIDSCLEPGREESVDIYLTLDSATADSAINIYAEISNDDGEDIDSTADNSNNNDTGAVPNSDTDDSINGEMGDEDDHDVAQIIVGDPGVYDLALINGISSSFETVYCPGDEVRYNTVIYNTGDVEACNVEITAYIPEGMTASDSPLNSIWTINGSTATTNITSCIPPGGVYPNADSDILSAFLILELDNTAGSTINFYSEISMDDGEDKDSTADNDPNNDAGADPNTNTDNTIHNQGGDEDDHDVASITVDDDCGGFGVRLDLNPTIGDNPVVNDNKLTIENFYPSIVSNTIQVVIASDNKLPAFIQIVDLNGMIVFDQSFKAKERLNRFDLNVDFLNNGVYLLQVKKGKQVTTHKFIVE